MGQVFTISRENKQLEEMIKFLSENKEDIKDIICIIRHRSGDINVVDSGSSFETKCSGSKMLDYMINEELDSDNYDDEDEEDELEESE